MAHPAWTVALLGCLALAAAPPAQADCISTHICVTEEETWETLYQHGDECDYASWSAGQTSACIHEFSGHFQLEVRTKTASPVTLYHYELCTPGWTCTSGTFSAAGPQVQTLTHDKWRCEDEPGWLYAEIWASGGLGDWATVWEDCS